MTTQNCLATDTDNDQLRAMYIDVAAMTVTEIVLPSDEPQLFDAVKQAIGCKVLAIGSVLPNDDVLYVNHSGLIECQLYFKHSLVNVPIPDNAILIGSVRNIGTPCSVRSSLANTRASVQFMDRWAALEWSAAIQEKIVCKAAA